MGYTSSSYRQVLKERILVYLQLQKYDFTEGCVDVMRIYKEVSDVPAAIKKGNKNMARSDGMPAGVSPQNE